MAHNNILQNMSEAMLLGRKRKKWTQQQCATKIGISRTYYSDIENGKALPSFEVILKINELFPFFLMINDAERKKVNL